MPGPSPSRNDSVTTRPARCAAAASNHPGGAGTARTPAGRLPTAAGTSPSRRRANCHLLGLAGPSPSTSDGCGARELGDQYCGECRTFMRRIGVGGCCPACFEAVAYDELSAEPS